MARKSRSRKTRRRTSRRTRSTKSRSRTSRRRTSRRSKKSKCSQRLSKKIAINIREGLYSSRAQAIAVAYSQIRKKYPHCSRSLSR